MTTASFCATAPNIADFGSFAGHAAPVSPDQDRDQGQAVADGRELFLGEPAMRDVPLNEPFELEVGKASDIEVRERTVSETALGSGAHRVARLAMEYELTNAKSAPVTLEVRQSRDAPGYRVVAESQAHFVKNGQDVWRVALPANAAVTLAYTVERNE